MESVEFWTATFISLTAAINRIYCIETVWTPDWIIWYASRQSIRTLTYNSNANGLFNRLCSSNKLHLHQVAFWKLPHIDGILISFKEKVFYKATVMHSFRMQLIQSMALVTVPVRQCDSNNEGTAGMNTVDLNTHHLLRCKKENSELY